MIVDLSHHNGIVGWGLLLDSGIEAAFVKASDGYFMAPNYTGHIDPQFQNNWTALGNNAAIRGAYHFLRLDYDRGVIRPNLFQQADIFADTVQPVDTDMVVLDIEPPHAEIAYLGREGVRTRTLAALNIFEEKLGRKPIIYTAQWWWGEYFTDLDDFSDYDLWSAHYWTIYNNKPLSPFAKPQHVSGFGDSIFWQYSMYGKVPGVAGSVDLNYYLGDIPLEDYVGLDPTTPPVPPTIPPDTIELDSGQSVTVRAK